MGSKSYSSATLFLALNLLFLSLVAATYCPPPPPPSCEPCTKPTPTPKPKSPPSAPKTPKTPTPKTPTAPVPKTPTPTTPSPRNCPRDVLQLGVCGNLLGGLLNIVIGTPSNRECCSLLQGLADLDAAICLCTAIKANVLGINLNVPISLSLLLNSCGYSEPSKFHCA